MRALDPDGFLAKWSLRAIKGCNTLVGLVDSATSAPPGGTYPGEIVDTLNVGTAERAGADVDGYVALTIDPWGRGFGPAPFCIRICRWPWPAGRRRVVALPESDPQTPPHRVLQA